MSGEFGGADTVDAGGMRVPRPCHRPKDMPVASHPAGRVPPRDRCPVTSLAPKAFARLLRSARAETQTRRRPQFDLWQGATGVKTIAVKVLLRGLLEGSDDGYKRATMTSVVRHLHARSVDNVTVYGQMGALSRALGRIPAGPA